jgi:hypothetical protein
MLEVGRQLDFLFESLSADLAGEIRWEDLHHYLAIERGFRRQKQTAHAPAGQLALEPVRVSEGSLESGLEIGWHENLW